MKKTKNRNDSKGIFFLSMLAVAFSLLLPGVLSAPDADNEFSKDLLDSDKKEGPNADFKDELYKLSKIIGQTQMVDFGTDDEANIRALENLIAREKNVKNHADFVAWKTLNGIDKKYQEGFFERYKLAQGHLANAQMNAYKSILLLQENKIAEAEAEYNKAKDRYDKHVVAMDVVSKEVWGWKSLPNDNPESDWKDKLYDLSREIGQEHIVSLATNDSGNLEALAGWLATHKNVRYGNHSDFEKWKKLNNITKAYERNFSDGVYNNTKENLAYAQSHAYKAVVLIQQNKLVEAEQEYNKSKVRYDEYKKWLARLDKVMNDWLSLPSESNYNGGNNLLTGNVVAEPVEVATEKVFVEEGISEVAEESEEAFVDEKTEDKKEETETGFFQAIFGWVSKIFG